MHRSIVCVDVEAFGDQHRTNAHRLTVRDGLYHVLSTAFTQSGIPWGDCYHEDRGDGAFILINPDVPKNRLVARLPHELVAALARHNHSHRAETRIKLRAAIHAGEVHHDGHGVTGADLNDAFRLLDAAPLKSALRTSPGVLALITSEWFFDHVVRHDPASAPATYRRVQVRVKETTTTAWLRLPDYPDQPAPEQPHDEQYDTQPPGTSSTSNTFSGGTAHRVVQVGAVHGDINIGAAQDQMTAAPTDRKEPTGPSATPPPARIPGWKSRRGFLLGGIAVVITIIMVAPYAAKAWIRPLLTREYELREALVVSLHVQGKPMVYSGDRAKRARIGDSLAANEPRPAWRWDVLPAWSGGVLYHRFVSRDNEQCLEVESNAMRQYSYLNTSPCGDGARQLWRLLDGGKDTRIASRDGVYCIDIDQTSLAAGTTLVLDRCSGGRRSQRWHLGTHVPSWLGSAIASAQHGMCVDVPPQGGPVHQWECHGDPNQLFTYQEAGTGRYMIRNGSGCLVARKGDPPRVVRRPACAPGGPKPDELWAIAMRDYKRGWIYREIKGVASGLCLRTEGEKDQFGVALSLKACDRTDNYQQWRTPEWITYPGTPR